MAEPRRAPTAAPGALPPPAPAPRRLWLAIHLTALPLVALGETTAGPAVVVEGEGAQRLLVACNAAGSALGLRAGLRLTAAYALAPTLRVAARDPRREARHLEALARWARSLTPCVSLEPPDQLLLEVQGSLRLFGGLAALVERAAADLEARGQTVAFAVAPTPRAALWLVQGAPGTILESPSQLAGGLARLGLAATRWSGRTLEHCGRLGLSTLGELRRLPREGLARRFEPGLLEELDEAYGQRPGPRRRHVFQERFQERLELPCELEHVDALTPYCRELLERLGDFLKRRDAGVTTLVFTCLHRDGTPTSVRLGRALPAAGADEWQDLLGERLGRLRLPAPVRALLLRSGALAPRAGDSVPLPGVGASDCETQAFVLLDRLRARLGEAAVSGVCLVPEHRPEAAVRRVRPVPVASGSRAEVAPGPLPAGPRPLWLLATPEPLGQRDGRPWQGGALTFESGPERIESGWWDGAGIARDYYIARTAAGQRLWIFRDRAVPQPHRWCLHGVFG